MTLAGDDLPIAPSGRARPWLAYALALAIILADQASKFWIVNGLHFGPGSSISVLGPIRLTFVYNEGISFGLLQGSGWGRWLLAGFSAVVAVALAVWAWRSTRLALTIGIGLVIGGAIGNLIDRILLGRVIDFFDFSALMFPWVFNIADSAITIGVLILLYDQLTTPDPAKPDH